MLRLETLAVADITATANAASQDYWKAIGNEELAEQRALQMEKLSYTDQLTQLNNRSFFDRRYPEEWKHGSSRKPQLRILMLDLDQFKTLNDKYGHLLGGQCLQRIAVVGERLRLAVAGCEVVSHRELVSSSCSMGPLRWL